jgi:serine phosphatase RsbU (regulator of sigma subunit)
VTAIFGILHPEARKFTYINAGHHEPFIIRDRSHADIMKSPIDADLPIGIEKEYEYRLREFELPDRPAMMVFYTDGVMDAENDTGDMYGEERFAQAIANQMSQPTDELVVRLRRSIKQFTRNTAQTDDITLLAVEIA